MGYRWVRQLSRYLATFDPPPFPRPCCLPLPPAPSSSRPPPPTPPPPARQQRAAIRRESQTRRVCIARPPVTPPRDKVPKEMRSCQVSITRCQILTYLSSPPYSLRPPPPPPHTHTHHPLPPPPPPPHRLPPHSLHPGLCPTHPVSCHPGDVFCIRLSRMYVCVLRLKGPFT